MTNKKMLFLAVLALFIAFAVSPVYAQGKSKRDFRQKERIERKIWQAMDFLFEHKEMLELSDKQIGQLKELNISTQKTMIQSKADIDILTVDIDAKLYDAESIDLKSLEKLIDEKYKFKKERVKTLVRAYAKIMDILTVQQKDALKNIKPVKEDMPFSPMNKGCYPLPGKMSGSKGGRCPMLTTDQIPGN